MRRLKKLLMPSANPSANPPPAANEVPEEEIESLLLSMFRELPQNGKQTVLEVVTEVYALAKKIPS